MVLIEVSSFSRYCRSFSAWKKNKYDFQTICTTNYGKIVAKTIERISLLAIEELLLSKIFKKEKDKKDAMNQQNNTLSRQLAIQTAIAAVSSFGGFFELPFKNKGGSVRKGPVVVGDSASGKGGELFVPNSSGRLFQIQDLVLWVVQ